jgi:glucose/arabinose dehydrogenase
VRNEHKPRYGLVTAEFRLHYFCASPLIGGMRQTALAFLLAITTCGRGAPPPPPSKGTEMHYGPVLSCTVEMPPSDPEDIAERAKRPAGPAPPSPFALARIAARKGLVIHLQRDDPKAANVCYDTDTLRMAAAWTGGFLDLSETNIGTYKGNRTGAAMIDGQIVFSVSDGPGWSVDGRFDDPRENRVGPMPRALCRFKGFYLHGNDVVLACDVAGADLLEKVEWIAAGTDGERFITRTLLIETKRPTTLSCLVARAASLTVESSDDRVLVLKDNPRDETSRLALALLDGDHAQWDLQPDRISLQLHAVDGKTASRFAYWHGHAADIPKVRRALGKFPAMQNLRALTNGGPARWPEVAQLQGTVRNETAAYALDTIPIPEENPWKSWMRISAFDFFPDGRAAVATLNGDVWIVSGLDDKLAQVRWKRCAIGLYEPLGVKVLDGKIFVHGRDRITRLHDSNGDEEADFYESFNSDRIVYPSYHAYAYDLQADREGNLFYVVGGAWLGTQRPWHSALFKVSKDGAHTNPVAGGFRAPNGMAIGPHDEITVSDNQGNWIPASKISIVRPGGFYGFVADPRVEPDAKGPESFDQPLCWIPQLLDNSSGGQVWAASSWGPLGGKLLHTSYGAAALFAVLDERVDQVAQGGVMKFPLKFDSVIMRARVGPHDGQVYVAGLKGWQTAGSKEGCMQRVRYTGGAFYAPVALHIVHDGIVLRFAVPLDSAAAVDLQNYAINQWNYRWASTYGSPDLSVAHPGAVGRDEVQIRDAALSADGKEVHLSIPHLQPVMQMQIVGNLRARDAHEVRFEIANTIHRVPHE